MQSLISVNVEMIRPALLLFCALLLSDAWALRCLQCDEVQAANGSNRGDCEHPVEVQCGRGDTHCVSVHETVPEAVYRKKGCGAKTYCDARNFAAGSGFASSCRTCDKNFCNAEAKGIVQVSRGQWDVNVRSQVIRVKSPRRRTDADLVTNEIL